MRGEHQHGGQAFAQRAGDATRPEALDLAGQALHQIVDFHLLQRHGARRGPDHLDLPAQARQPGRDVVGIGDGTGEEEELNRGGQGGQHALVVVAPGRVAEPLVFVDDEQVGQTRGHNAVGIG